MSVKMQASAERIAIVCGCTVCGGRGVTLPASLMKGSEEGTPDHETAVHNFVCLGFSPLGRMGFPQIKKIER
jgi:hypothetical protein